MSQSARTRTAPVASGFLAPVLFDDELVEFFAQANLGPVISGELVDKTGPAGHTRSVPNPQSLRPTNQPLNSILFFTQPTVFGETNPLHRVATPGMLIPLFALHAYYSGMQNPNDPTRLSASEEMRALLPNLIARTTQRDFDPENFLYAHFSKLISSAAVSQRLTPQDFEVLLPEITRVYQPLFPGARLITPEMVLEYQQNEIALARAYKNNIQSQTQRTLRQQARTVRQPTMIPSQQGAQPTRSFMTPTLSQRPQPSMTPAAMTPTRSSVAQAAMARLELASQVLQSRDLAPEQVDELLRQIYSQ